MNIKLYRICKAVKRYKNPETIAKKTGYEDFSYIEELFYRVYGRVPFEDFDDGHVDLDSVLECDFEQHEYDVKIRIVYFVIGAVINQLANILFLR